MESEGWKKLPSLKKLRKKLGLSKLERQALLEQTRSWCQEATRDGGQSDVKYLEWNTETHDAFRRAALRYHESGGFEKKWTRGEASSIAQRNERDIELITQYLWRQNYDDFYESQAADRELMSQDRRKSSKDTEENKDPVPQSSGLQNDRPQVTSPMPRSQQTLDSLKPAKPHAIERSPKSTQHSKRSLHSMSPSDRSRESTPLIKSKRASIIVMRNGNGSCESSLGEVTVVEALHSNWATETLPSKAKSLIIVISYDTRHFQLKNNRTRSSEGTNSRMSEYNSSSGLSLDSQKVSPLPISSPAEPLDSSPEQYTKRRKSAAKTQEDKQQDAFTQLWKANTGLDLDNDSEFSRKLPSLQQEPIKTLQTQPSYEDLLAENARLKEEVATQTAFKGFSNQPTQTLPTPESASFSPGVQRWSIPQTPQKRRMTFAHEQADEWFKPSSVKSGSDRTSEVNPTQIWPQTPNPQNLNVGPSYSPQLSGNPTLGSRAFSTSTNPTPTHVYEYGQRWGPPPTAKNPFLSQDRSYSQGYYNQEQSPAVVSRSNQADLHYWRAINSQGTPTTFKAIPTSKKNDIVLDNNPQDWKKVREPAEPSKSSSALHVDAGLNKGHVATRSVEIVDLVDDNGVTPPAPKPAYKLRTFVYRQGSPHNRQLWEGATFANSTTESLFNEIAELMGNFPVRCILFKLLASQKLFQYAVARGNEAELARTIKEVTRLIREDVSNQAKLDFVLELELFRGD